MRINMQRLSLLLIFLVAALGAWADLSDYSFTQSTVAYSEITGGTILGTNQNNQESFDAIPLGFNFTFNEVEYTQISVQTDGYIAFGSTVAQNNNAISAATGTNNLAVAFNRDLKSKDDGSLSYLLSGTAPNRVFTIQWKNYRRSPTNAANDVINFQIQLQENGNKISLHYGLMQLLNISTASTVQVGLRGDSSNEFLNRTTLTDWLATTAGTANNANCKITDQIFPPSGLMFSYAPPQQGTVPLPAQSPNPAHNASNVLINKVLSWTTGGGVVDGYKVYLGTNNPPTNLVNGTSITSTSYDHPTDFNYSTTYFWKIVPFNSIGDAANCPVWQFGTLADPTVSSYPYTQDFDSVTIPALPLGWSAINANNDAYTWETSDVNPHSSPNCVRMRYSSSVAADDWLVSPPLSLEADMAYKVKFYYRAHSATFVEKLSLAWGNAPTVAALSNQIWQNNSISNVAYQEAEAVLMPTQTGTYYIGFKASSDANQYYLYLDSITISELEDSMDPPTHLTAEVTGRNVNLNWWAPGQTPPPDPDLEDGFETYTDFALNFDPWVCVDVDQSGTYGMTNIDWPNAYAAQAFMIFNPSTTTPPITDLSAHAGNKMAACFAATTAPNNDWLISPQFTPSAGQCVNFWARSYTAQYGLERFKVGISQGGTAPANFTIISTGNYVQAPDNWTLYSYDVSSYAGQSIRFGINCVSNDAFFLLVDDVSVGPIPANRTHDSYAGQFMGTATKTTGVPIPGPLYSSTSSRDLLGYKVYRDGALIATITDTHYQDANVALGTYSYTVTANYTAGESDPAGPVTVTVAPNVFPPTNLAAQVIGNTANLTWDEPVDPGEGMWLTWCQDVIDDAIGTNGAVTFDVAHRFTQADLAVVAGGTITEVKIAPHEANAVYTVKVWTGGSASNAGTLVSSQVVSNPTLDAWNTITLNTPVTIPSTGDVYIGYECNTQTGYPAGCDSGPAVDGKGNMMYFNGSWSTLVALADIQANWLIQTYVDTGFGRVLLEPKPIVEAPVASHSNARLAKAGMTPISLANNDRSRVFLGYKVYRNDAVIATVNTPNYSDTDLAIGTYSYKVTANYSDGESTPAGPVEVVIANNPGPLNLSAEVNENNVTLNWENPDGPMVGSWITWANDVLGNSVGTNSAATFSVAHRFTQDDIAQLQATNGLVTQVKIVPAYQNCVYTVKVWTGGSATNPGTLMSTQAVPNFTLNEWTTVVLDTPVVIPTTGDLWVGYDVNTQGGHPAGCDDGPQIEGKGNMMYFNGSWTTLSQLASTLLYNWLIQTFVQDPNGAMKALTHKPIVEAPMPEIYTDAPLSLHHVNVDTSSRAVSGFKVYRDGNLIATIPSPEIETYTDMGVPNGTYTYGVTAIHPNGESTPTTIEVTVFLQMGELVFGDDFEAYPDFATTFAPWTLLDVDNAETYGFSNISFPGSGSRMAYIIFNPSATVPPIDGLDPHSGNKMAASFAATSGTNNDWMISPRIHLGSNSKLKFYARSHTAQYGLERFKVGVSILPNIIQQGFQWLNGDYTEAPTGWTEYLYDLNTYNGQNVRIAIRCVSNDAFVFYVDDFAVHSDGGSIVDIDDPMIPTLSTKLDANYPNPFNPSTTISYSLKEAGPVSIEIYNIKGQLVRTLVKGVKEAGNHTVIWNGLDKNNRSVSSGVYFYKMNAGKYSSTKKMIMMK